MSIVLSAVIFAALWVITFLPAWYLLIKLAVGLKRRPLDFTRIFILFIAYECIIVLPYVAVLLGVKLRSDTWVAAFSALVLLISISSILQLVNMKRIKGALWNVYARFYDSLLDFYPYGELVKLVCARTEKYIFDGGVIADIGCGTGNITLRLLESHPGNQFLIAEPSLQMLRRAEKKIGGKSSAGNVRYFNIDAVGFLSSIPDGSLDVIVMNNVLYTVMARKQFWNLLSEKLTRTGVAVIANPDREGSGSLIRYHNQHASRWSLLRPGMVIVGVIDDLISQLSGDKQFLFSSVREVQEELRATDLTMSDVERCYGDKENGIDILFTVRRKVS